MIVREEVFIYQETTSDGEEVGPRREFSWTGLQTHVAFMCRKYSLRDLRHMVDLLKTAHKQGFSKNPVDLTLWNKEKTALEWSARLWMKHDAS